jgi:anti-sigma factor RsiW
MKSSWLHGEERCPRMEALSALVDDELAGAARGEIQAHAASCPICSAALADIEALSVAFAALPQPPAQVDLARLVGERIRIGEQQARRAPKQPRTAWWRMIPATVGAAAALGMGAGAGNVLMVGAGAAARASVEMSVFATVPPGGLCLAGAACR